MTRSSIGRLAAVLSLVLASATAVFAQDNDRALKLAEPDFTLIGLPTALRVPKFKSAFRVTHRFTRPLDEGDFGDLAADLFGLDSGAQIGLEYRFGIIRGGQIGIHRTSNRTIELFGQYDVVQQGNRFPLDVSALATIEGTNNLQDSYSPALGAIVSRLVGTRAAFYVEPLWINNSNPSPGRIADHNDTFLIGLGARVRVRPTVYVTGEFTPRVSGYRPGVHQGGVAIEKRSGGHLFQVNFSNAFGTTLGQMARGGPASNDWHLGFNISRKFF